MRTDGKAEIQHYVPQLLLRLHLANSGARKGGEQVWCFDKKTDRAFCSNVKNVLAGSQFYEIELDGLVASLEPSLSGLEERVAPILSRVVASRSLQGLSADDRAGIAAFAAVQLIRTPAFRRQVQGLNEGMAEAFERKGVAPESLKGFRMMSDGEIKEFSLRALHDAPVTYGPYFIDKHWYLIEGAVHDPFHLGDHPVVRDSETGGDLGLASAGVSIYLPLSPTLCLVMTDPAVVAELKAGYVKAKRRHQQLRKRIAKRQRRTGHMIAEVELAEAAEMIATEFAEIRALMAGGPTRYRPQVVMRANALQMRFATRWVVSSRDDFSLPRQMISDDPKYREGALAEVVSG